jgi:hypothetical protein
MNESNFRPMSPAMQRFDALPSHRELLWGSGWNRSGQPTASTHAGGPCEVMITASGTFPYPLPSAHGELTGAGWREALGSGGAGEGT